MSNEPKLDSIAEAAAAAMDQSADPEVRFAALERRIAEIEPLLEQTQAYTALGTALTDYVGDLREEQKFFNFARYVVSGAALLVLVAISTILFLAIFHPISPLFKSDAHVVAVFVVAMLSGMVFIVTTFAKGLFRSTVERHADGFLPPALSEAEKLYSRLTGKSG